MLDRRDLLLAAASAFTHVGKPPELPTVPTALGDVLEKTGVPAVAYAVVDGRGLVKVDAAGVRRRGSDDAVAAEDVWHLGSNTKAMTAARYARLVEQGRANWDARIPALFPDLKVDPAWAKLGMEELFAHRAGVSDDGLIDEGLIVKANADTRPVAVQRTEFAAAVLQVPPNGRPGTFDFSNASYILAGAALERAAGMDWEAAMTAGLFQPLGMATAGFGAPTGAAPWGHESGSGGGLSAVKPGPAADNPPLFGPAGRVHASLPDYAKFVRVFLADGAGYLAPASLARLSRPWSGEAEGYALGWELRPERAWARGPVMAHEGSNSLWRASVLAAPGRPLAFLVAVNADGEGGPRAVQLMNARLIAQYAIAGADAGA